MACKVASSTSPVRDDDHASQSGVRLTSWYSSVSTISLKSQFMRLSKCPSRLSVGPTASKLSPTRPSVAANTSTSAVGPFSRKATKR